MSNSYQAIYDAVRSKITGGDVSDAIYRALDMSQINHAVSCVAQDIAVQYGRPSAVFKPRVFPDGNMWCALYGENLQEGVAGFGKSPDEACIEFDKAWNEKLASVADHPIMRAHEKLVATLKAGAQQ